jgi:CHAD domain-containing protein
MEIERENAQKPLRKLRKVLKRLPSVPAPEDVHALRTHSRRLEAIVNALMLDRKKKTRQLLKKVTPVRKAAGDVRDMDVLVGNVLALSQGGEDESLVRLVEHLGERRVESARELHQTVSRNKKDARRSLKDYTKLVGKQFPGKKEIMTSAAPAPSDIATELAKWPKLNAENIHPFRIKVKQLRYMLQLSGEVDREIEAALGKVKDEVGDWHDWQELAGIAKQVLDSRKDRTALKRIEEIGDGKFKQALAAANELREEYFSNGWKGKSKKKRTRNAKA